ncbi:hypothetical protein GCM10027168_13860 [Streptomyces capparidis]
MATTWNGRAVTFRQATASQVHTVLRVLDEAAAWLRERHIDQWPARFEAAWVEGAVARGETWLVHVGGEVAGTATLDWSDPLWTDVEGSAGYLHRMAVRRRWAGLGAAVLDWAGDTARGHGKEALRLDCVSGNHRLRAYYEARGFHHRGDAPVGGAPGQRARGGPVTWVSRYEHPLRPLPS